MIANSEKCFFDEEHYLKSWQASLDQGQKADQGILSTSKDLNLRNSIL
jgi:hypothetical protein